MFEIKVEKFEQKSCLWYNNDYSTLDKSSHSGILLLANNTN